MPRNEPKYIALKVAAHAQPLQVKVNQRRGMRHLKVMVNVLGEVVLNIPYGVSRATAMTFLDDQTEWIALTLEKVEPKLRLREHLLKRPLLSGLGRDYAVLMCHGRKAGYDLDYDGGCVALNFEEDCMDDTVLLRSLRAFASENIPLRVADLARSRGLSYSRVSVRDQRSRWGSCSERRTLSFNWRMILLPTALHDYLIWHELAHLVHLNHSPGFWHQVSIYDPGWEKHDSAITEYSNLLMSLGRKRSS